MGSTMRALSLTLVQVHDHKIKTQVLLFAKRDTKLDGLLKEFKAAAAQFRGQFLFVHIDAEQFKG